MKYIVYQTININNNKIYIGVHKTEDPNVFDGYLGCGVYINSPSSYMNPHTSFQYAVKKYGTKSFKRTIIKVFDTLEDAFKLERELVNYDFINRSDVYNSALGGQGGNQSFIKINQFSLDGKLIKKWNSIMEASEFIGVYHTAICRAYKYKGSCKGFLWSVEDTINISEYTVNQGTICYKYDGTTGKYLDMYNSLPETAKENNIDNLSMLQRAINGGYKLHGNYYSTKLLEEYNGKPKVSIKNKIIYIYDLNGTYLTELKTSSEIKQFFNINSTSSITTALRMNKPYREYQLSLTKESSLPPIQSKRNISKKVGRYSLGGELLETFSSITEALNKWGSGAARCAQGKQQQCKGYLFKIIS